MSEARARRWLPLVLLLACAAVPRLLYLSDGFVRLDEWSTAQFAVYANQYLRFGFLETRLLPVFGIVDGQLIAYVNHPILGSLILGIWFALVGASEAATRWLALLFSLGTLLVLYRIAELLWDRRAAFLSALIYAFMPLSIYLGRVYTMEEPQNFFCLLGIYLAMDWQRKGRRVWLWAAAGCLLASALCDYYTVYLVPYLLLMAWRQKQAGLALLAGAPVAALALHLGYVAVMGLLPILLTGAAKFAPVWTYALEGAAHLELLKRLLAMTGFVPVPLALFGFLRLARERGPGLTWLGLIAWIPLADLLTLYQAVLRHDYRVMYFLVPVALCAGRALARFPTGWSALALGTFALLSVAPTRALYGVQTPGDPETGRRIRELTTDRDLLLGLPPPLAYYANRPAMVPYHYFWTPAGEEGRALALSRLRAYADCSDYDRIVLFTQFIVRSPKQVGAYVDQPYGKGSHPHHIDFSKAFDGLDELERVTSPGEDPQVWRRRRPAR